MAGRHPFEGDDPLARAGQLVEGRAAHDAAADDGEVVAAHAGLLLERASTASRGGQARRRTRLDLENKKGNKNVSGTGLLSTGPRTGRMSQMVRLARESLAFASV